LVEVNRRLKQVRQQGVFAVASSRTNLRKVRFKSRLNLKSVVHHSQRTCEEFSVRRPRWLEYSLCLGMIILCGIRGAEFGS
jgi:hypothetical protein